MFLEMKLKKRDPKQRLIAMLPKRLGTKLSGRWCRKLA
jgi:hypothetical protein